MKSIITRIALALLLIGMPFRSIPKVQAASQCSNETLEGTYGGAATGFFITESQVVTGSVVHFAVAGTATFDGRGNISGGTTESIDGVIQQGDTFEGTYTVKANCTGSTSFTGHHPGYIDHHNFDLVIVDGGKGIVLIETDAGVVFTITLTRQ